MSDSESDNELEFNTREVKETKTTKVKKPLTPAQEANLKKMRESKAAKKQDKETQPVEDKPKPKKEKKETPFKEEPIFNIDRIFGSSDNTSVMLSNLNNHIEYLTKKVKRVSQRQKEDIVRREQKAIKKQAPQYQVNKPPDHFTDLAHQIMHSRY